MNNPVFKGKLSDYMRQLTHAETWDRATQTIVSEMGLEYIQDEIFFDSDEQREEFIRRVKETVDNTGGQE